MSKSVSKGHLIDEHCKYTDGTLIDKNGVVYSCMLNQTDLKTNKNKFYTMQLIKSGSNYIHFIRYGRISEVGKICYKDFSSLNSAINSFESQFRTKTRNKWSDKDNFVKKDGKYFLTEISYEDELKDIKDVDNLKVPKSKLPKRVQDLIKMISDIDMMKNTLISFDIDTKKMPLGKLNQKQINEAKKILDIIETKLKNKGILKNDSDSSQDSEELLQILDDDIVDLCSKYYTYIPYGCNRRAKPPLIKNKNVIDKYREILTNLSDIAIGVQIINKVKADENPVDSIYTDINTKITPLKRNCGMWKEIVKYINNTHGPTHYSKLEVLDIFKVEQKGKQNKFDEYCKNIGNNTLLFHGTPQSCVLSIFKRDFYLDPTKLGDSKINISGKMLGWGIYFADMATKSFNYTCAQNTTNIGCLIIGEVAVGKMNEKNYPDYNITKNSLAKQNYHSALGIGRWGPTTSTIYKGVKIPNGPVKELRKNTYLRYNEFVIYDVNQVVIRYLVTVKNNGGYGGY